MFRPRFICFAVIFVGLCFQGCTFFSSTNSTDKVTSNLGSLPSAPEELGEVVQIRDVSDEFMYVSTRKGFVFKVPYSNPDEKTLIANAEQEPLVTVVSADGRRVAMGFLDEVNVHSLIDDTVWRLKRLKGRVQALAFHPDGNSLLISVGSNRVFRWKFFQPDKGFFSFSRALPLERYLGHSSVVNHVLFHPFGRIFFSSDWQGSLLAWELYDSDSFDGYYDENVFRSRYYTAEATLQNNRGDGQVIPALSVSNDGKWLSVGTVDGNVELWRVRGFRKVVEVAAHDGAVASLAFNKDTTGVASLGRDGRVFWWSVSELTGDVAERPGLERVYQALESDARVVHVSPSGKVWVGTAEGTVREVLNFKKVVALKGMN